MLYFILGVHALAADPSIDCKPLDGQNAFKASSDSVKFQCTIQNVETPTLKAKVGQGSESDDINAYNKGCGIDNSNTVTCSFEGNADGSNSVGVALVSGGSIIGRDNVEVSLFPTPTISSIKDSNGDNQSYIAGSIIIIDVTPGKSFKKFASSSIVYGFVTDPDSTLKSPTKYSGQLTEAGDGKYNLKIAVPDSENTAGQKYLKIQFTDLAGQTVDAKLKVTFLQTVKFEEEKPADASAQEGKTEYKSGEDVVVTFKLSNLEKDFKDSEINFTYVFGDKTGSRKLVPKENVNVISSSKRITRETKSAKIILNIPVPEDAKGNTTLNVWAVDKEGHDISQPLTKEISITQKPKATPDDNPPLSPGAIAGVVIAVLVIVAIICVAVFYFLCKNKTEKSDSMPDSGSGIQV